MKCDTNSRRPYFILTCARSGSSSVTKILDRATNGCCAMEPMPNLNVETRDVMEGRRHDVDQIVASLVVPRVEQGMRNHGIYGEKNLTYGPFITALYRQLNCRFVFLIRDGREVVRSLLDWHNLMFGEIYRECREAGCLNDIALKAAANLPAWQDTSDYSRPRPQYGDLLHELWPQLTRFEMCAWYWATVNELYLEQLDCIPSEDWILLDYTRPEASQIERVASFLSLEGLGYEQIKKMLDARINSLSDRGVIAHAEQKYPHYLNWTEVQHEAFDLIAGATMKRLGY